MTESDEHQAVSPQEATAGRWLQYLDAITGLAVVATLVVLIVDVRSNTRMMERQLIRDRAAHISAPFLSSEELLSAYEHVKSVDGWEPSHLALMDRYEMTPAQAVAWDRFLFVFWWGFEADYLSSGPSDGLERGISGALSFPDNDLFWSHSRGAFHPRFAAYVERIRQNIPPLPESAPVDTVAVLPSE